MNVAFRDVDVAELLKTAGVDVPVKVGGRVTVQVQVDIPTETPDEFRTYRLAGTVKSKRATVDELAIEELSARLDFRDGKLSVKQFAGRLPGLALANAEAGSFRGPRGTRRRQGVPIQGNGQARQGAARKRRTAPEPTPGVAGDSPARRTSTPTWRGR